MNEHDYAKMEGSRIACCDAYFDARPDRDYHINRSLFDAGHDAGWKDMQIERDDLLTALQKIAAIEDQYDCGDWEEINQARAIANEAIANASK